MTSLHAGHLFWRALGNYLSAAVSALRPKINQPVRSLDDVQVVFNHQHRVALIHQTSQHDEQTTNVFKVQPGGRLIQEINGVACAAPRQLAGQLYALGFATRQCWRRLPEPYIAQPHIHECLQMACDARLVGKKLNSFANGHVQHFGHVLAFEANLQCVAVVARTLAHFARHIHIGQKLHLDANRAIARARFTASAGHVERKPSRLVTAHLGVG